MASENRKLIKEAEELGFSASFTQSNHIRFTHAETGVVVFAPTSPSDHRSISNVIGKLRRAARQQKPLQDS